MIIIDPGHGGKDPGAVSELALEKDLALEVSKYHQKRFEELGIKTDLTRTDDETLISRDRIKRIDELTTPETELILSNHFNSGGGTGFEVLSSINDQTELGGMILDEVSKTGFKVRGEKQRRSNVNPNLDYYFMLRETQPLQALIIEYGFIDSPTDLAYLQDNWEVLAEAVVKAVAEYLGYVYTPPKGYMEYIVKSGDTLSEIARDYNTTVADIKLLNGLTSDRINIGQVLLLPSTELPADESKYLKAYTVKDGDTLSEIAKANNISTEDLLGINQLKSDIIYPNQILYIPTSSMDADYEIYFVKDGDTLSEIARDYAVSISDMVEINGFESDIIYPGQPILIPVATTVMNYPNDDLFEHIVKSNETLFNISDKFKISVNEIKNINSLDSNLVFEGQVLLIPYPYK